MSANFRRRVVKTILVCGSLLLAFVVGSGSATADSAYVVLRKSGDGNRYFVVFAARSSYGGGMGHAFVAFGKEDSQARESSFSAFGLYPKNRTTFWDKLLFRSTVVYGSVPAELVDEIQPYTVDPDHYSVPDMTDTLVIEVDKSIYDRSVSLALMTMGNPGNFKVIQRDCVTMLQSVAAQVGISVPSRDLDNVIPQAYVKSLIKTATTPVTITTPAWTWKGQTFMGLPTRDGTYTFPGGDKFVGTVQSGWLNGRGKMTYHTGDAYIGDLIEGKPDGSGVFTSTDGYIYDCKWAGGVPQNGTITTPKGDKFVGNFKDGKPVNGSLTFGEGDLKGANYTGDFQPDFQFGGQGTGTMPNGDKYVGGWANSKQQGWGTVYRHGFPPYSTNWNQGHDAGGAPPAAGATFPPVQIPIPVPITPPTVVTGTVTPN